MASPDLPALDTHAHLATDVTAMQVRRLGDAVIFCVTRSLSEAAAAPHGVYPNLLWGLGVHPGSREALERYDGDRFEGLLPKFALVGEVGLDRRAGRLDRQREVLSDLLARLHDAPVLLSIHSSGATDEILALLGEHRPRAPVLHWFGGDLAQCQQASDLGAWFSVNAAMSDEVIRSISRDRVLSETDFPFTRRAGSSRPGATAPVEARLGLAWTCTPAEVRRTIWTNLSLLCGRAGVGARLPKRITELISEGDQPTRLTD